MKVIKPRCPGCRKVQSEWLEGASGYTCPRCGLKFTINTEVLDKLPEDVIK